MTDLRALFGMTLRRPAAAARALLALNLPMRVVMWALGAVVSVNAILSFVSLRVAPPPPDMQTVVSQVQPIGFAAFLVFALVVISAALTVSGRVLGGSARFSQMLLCMLWVQAVMLVFEAALIVALVLVPPLAAIAALPVYALTMVLVVVFVQQAHGFQNPLRAVGAMLLGLFGLGMVLQLFIPIA